MLDIEIERNLAGLQDLLFGVGQVEQIRDGVEVLITRINASNLPFDETKTLKEVIDTVEKRHIELGKIQEVLRGIQEKILTDQKEYDKMHKLSLAELERAIKLVSDVKGRVNDYFKDYIAKLEAKIAETLKTTTDKLHSALDKYYKALEEVKAITEQNLIYLHETQPVVEDTKTKVEATKPLVEATKATVEATKPLVEATKATVDNIKTTTDSIKTTVDTNKTTVEATKATSDTIKTTTDTISNNLVGIKAGVDAIKPVVEDTKPLVEGVYNAATSSQGILHRVGLTSNAIKEDTDNIKTNVESIKTNTDSIKPTTDTIKTNIEEIKTSVTSLGAIKQQIDMLRSLCVALQGNIRDKSDETKTIVESIKTTTDKVEGNLAKLVVGTNAVEGAVNKRLEELKSTLKEGQDLVKTNETFNSINKNLDELKSITREGQGLVFKYLVKDIVRFMLELDKALSGRTDPKNTLTAVEITKAQQTVISFINNYNLHSHFILNLYTQNFTSYYYNIEDLNKKFEAYYSYNYSFVGPEVLKELGLDGIKYLNSKGYTELTRQEAGKVHAKCSKVIVLLAFITKNNLVNSTKVVVEEFLATYFYEKKDLKHYKNLGLVPESLEYKVISKGTPEFSALGTTLYTHFRFLLFEAFSAIDTLYSKKYDLKELLV